MKLRSIQLVGDGIGFWMKNWAVYGRYIQAIDGITLTLVYNKQYEATYVECVRAGWDKMLVPISACQAIVPLP